MSTSLRAEFMAGAEPFQDSIREFQQGMTDFSHTLSDAADPKKWAEGTPYDASAPAAESEIAEPISAPERTKHPKLEITPPVNPWAPLPGSGADTDQDADAEAEVSPDVSSTDATEESDADETNPSSEAPADADQVEKNWMMGPPVSVLPPFTGSKRDDEAELAVEPAPDEESV
jgi:hypothetical protein